MASLLKPVANSNDVRGANGEAAWIGIRVDLGGGQFAYVVAAGASLAHFREFDIPEWVSTSDGKVWRFEGVCEDIEAASCHDGLLTLPPGLFMR